MPRSGRNRKSGALHGPETLVERPMTYLSIIIYRAEST
jgi:hypothetical protein